MHDYFIKKVVKIFEKDDSAPIICLQIYEISFHYIIFMCMENYNFMFET